MSKIFKLIGLVLVGAGVYTVVIEFITFVRAFEVAVAF